MPGPSPRKRLGSALGLSLIIAFAGCSGGGGGSSSTPAPPPAPQNTAPVANAGADQTAIEDQTVFLDGSESSDADGTIATFRWTQTGGPDVPLGNADTAAARFVSPEVDTDTVLSFELTVTDNDGATARDTTNVTVGPDPVDDAEVVAFAFDGKPRAYTLYTPDSFVAGNPAFFVLHGGGQSMRRILAPDTATRRWVELADREGALLIVPNGFNNGAGSGLGDNQSWNDIRVDNAGVTSSEDDAGFLVAVLDDAAARADFDTGEVYIAGSSNGGIMTMTMLIQFPERFAAGAAFIAALPEESVPDPAQPTPFFMLNGTDDPLILFDGGPVGANGSPTRSVNDTIDYWVRVTGSDPGTEFFMSLPNNDTTDNCEITVSEYSDGPGGSPTFIYYEAVGGGHNIPDPTPPSFSEDALDLIGNVCRDAHGVDLAVDFFNGLP